MMNSRRRAAHTSHSTKCRRKSIGLAAAVAVQLILLAACTHHADDTKPDSAGSMPDGRIASDCSSSPIIYSKYLAGDQRPNLSSISDSQAATNGDKLYEDFIKYLDIKNNKATFTLDHFYPNTELTSQQILNYAEFYGSESCKMWLAREFFALTRNDQPAAGYAIWDDGISFFNWLTHRLPGMDGAEGAAPYMSP